MPVLSHLCLTPSFVTLEIMFRLLRTLCTLIGLCVLLLITLYFVRDSASRKLVEWTTYQLTSFPLFVSENEIPAQLPLKLNCRNLLLKNPIDFPHPQAALLSRMEVQFADKPWNQSQLQIAHLSLMIDELILVKTANAGNNFSRLSQTSQKTSAWFDSVRIQQLQFSINQILYYDYTQTSSPLPFTYQLESQLHNHNEPVTLKQVPALIIQYATQQISSPPGEIAL